MDTSLSETSTEEMVRVYTKEEKRVRAYKRTVVPSPELRDARIEDFELEDVYKNVSSKASDIRPWITYKELYCLSSSSEYDSNASCSRYRGNFVKGGNLLRLRYPCRCSGCITGVSCQCVCKKCYGDDLPKCRCIPCKVQRKEALRRLIGPTEADVSGDEDDGVSSTIIPTKRRLSSTNYVLEEEYSMEDAMRDVLEETRSYVPFYKYPRVGLYSDSSD